MELKALPESATVLSQERYRLFPNARDKAAEHLTSFKSSGKGWPKQTLDVKRRLGTRSAAETASAGEVDPLACARGGSCAGTSL
eukprot:6187424-Pleurochrysis_carterae.AAC.2